MFPKLARYAAVLVLSILFLLPLLFMLSGSLRPPGLPPPSGFEWVPPSLEWSNYVSVFRLLPLARFLLNSLLVAVIAVPLTVLVASLAGFAIATARPGIQKALVALSVVALMVPVSALWVPRFVMFGSLGAVDSYVPLIAPALMAATPFYVLLFALTYARVPRHLYEAARLEGLAPVAVWRRVALPLGRATTFAVAILAFIFYWSNFIDPLLYLSTVELYTLPLGLRALQTLEPANHPILLAGAVVATIPPIVAFVLAQRAFFVKTLEVR